MTDIYFFLFKRAKTLSLSGLNAKEGDDTKHDAGIEFTE